MASVFRQPFRLRLAVALIAALSLLAVMAIIGPPEATAQEVDGPEICLFDSQNNGLSGAKINHWTSGGWGDPIGYTGEDGCVTVTPKTTHTRLRIEYGRGAVETESIDFSDGYEFRTVSVSIISPNLVTYQGFYGGFGTISNPMELLPGNYTLADYYLNNRVKITVGTENLTVAIVRLVDHQGNPLAGGTATYTPTGTGWLTAPGETNAGGYMAIPTTNPNMSVRMHYKGTNQAKNLSQLQASNFTFQTTQVTVKLQNADGNPLDTGNVQYFALGWRTFGAGATVGGEATHEMLPGEWSIQMRYKSGLQTKTATVSGTTTVVSFQTGRITLHFSGEIQYWGNNAWFVYQKPTEEFLPNTVRFYLDGQSSIKSVDIDIAAGDKLVKSVILARLRDSSNQPIAGGVATAYVGGWKTVGETNSSGWVAAAFDGGPLGNTSVKMTHTGTSQQLTQHHATNSIYLFKTIGVVVELIDSSGARIDTGSGSYYAGGWKSIGDTDGGAITVQMLPGKYSFAMVYNGTREQMNNVVVQAGTVVTFQTSEVTVSLIDSNSNPLANGSATYYAGSWRTIGTTDGNGEITVEMLPGNYSFAMVYNGTREQMNSQTVNDDGVASAVGFQTIGVTVELVDSNGNDLAGASSYYAGSWRTIDSSGEVEMLTGKYSFAMTYLGTREQKNSVDIGANATVTFQTGQVFSSTSTGYYAGAWRSFTNGMELLKGKYTFRFSSGPNQSVTLPGDGDPYTIN